MALKFKNTLGGKTEEFKPIEPGKVRLYTCGPTVYFHAHIGNFRAYIFEDLLRRYLKYKGYEVTQVMNITDIDDKTIRDSRAEGLKLKEFTKRYIDAFFEDLDSLGIERADIYPAATDHIDEMVVIIQKLIENGLAYEVDGNYYFKVSKFPGYGQLANLDLTNLKPGARVASDEYEKESVSDFALWKAWEPEDGDVYWETPLGKGRPGWHIECSAMAMKYLGEQFDIHCGGVDNIFPHHVNEIAQSEGATGKKFVNYWMHNEHLIVEGKKMSKSLGNYFTLRDILDKGYPGMAVRYLLISTHYRQQLNFTFDGLDAARSALTRYNDFLTRLEEYAGGESDGSAKSLIETVKSGFEKALDDDLNASGALGAIFDFVRDMNRLMDSHGLSHDERKTAINRMKLIDTVLNFKASEAEMIDDEVEALIQKRTEARQNKDWGLADKIRDDLLAMGIILEDGSGGVKWKRKL